MSDAYAPPPPFTWPPITPRSLLPIFPPPEPLTKPELPSAHRKPAFDAVYALSTHLIPAAHLRTTDYVPEPPAPARDLPKSQRQEYAVSTVHKLRDLRGSLDPRGSRQVLWNCLNRYVRRGLKHDRVPGLTLFFAHANGFPKETWEPTLHHLLTSQTASVIDEVWTWESVQHGDSCLVNNRNLGGVFDWADNARDILNFLLYFLPSEAASAALPTHLDRVHSLEVEHRRSIPLPKRTLVVVGHSWGGASSVLAAQNYPHLFSSLILIDPVITKPLGHLPAYDSPTTNLVIGALTRRETWSSRQEALQSFSQSPFFGIWDQQVLKLYVECGTYSTKDPHTGKGVVSLKMPGMQEAVVFSDSHTRCEVFQGLPELDERIKLRWIMPGKSDAGEFGPPGSTRERVWARPKNASNTRIHDAGHLIPQEQPQSLAKDIEEFIRGTYHKTSQVKL